MTEPPQPEHETLARTLGVWALVLYGLGIIIGAGIYVLVGKFAGIAGYGTPVAFVLAGALAALTGLSYAELVGRYPAVEGSVAFVHHAFGSRWLSLVTGVALAAVGIVAAGSIALGGAAYVARWLPLLAPLIAGAAVAVFTVVAGLRVSESVRVAAFLSAAEVLGLALVLAAGAPALSEVGTHPAEMLPADGDAAPALGAGTFIAFFAYIGFEGMANMAEETEDVGRTLPRAILIALAVSAFLYAAVSLVAVLAVSPAVLADSPAPLVSVLEQRAPWLVDLFVVIAVVATLNGVLIEIVVVSRLAYGMARRGHWWTWLGRVDPRTRTPIHATTTVGALALGLVLAIPFDLLVILTSGLTLGVFAAVNASLWRLKRKEPRPHDVAIVVPTWVPVAGGLACAGLIAVMVARAF